MAFIALWKSSQVPTKGTDVQPARRREGVERRAGPVTCTMCVCVCVQLCVLCVCVGGVTTEDFHEDVTLQP